MLRIGMIGEYPTDVDCISSLLMKKYDSKVSFFPLIYDVHGSNLENPKIKHQLRREYQIVKPDFVLFIRDLDGLEDNLVQLEQRKAYFADFNNVVDKRGVLLLNIHELEALLLSDIGKLTSYYNVELDEIIDCMKIEDPKGYLKSRIKKYSTGDNVTLFSLLDYEQVLNNCRYFRRFNDDFSEIVKRKTA
jgi:hypothetical protein